MTNFPKDSGNLISAQKSRIEEAQYQAKYPGTTTSFDIDIEALLAAAKAAAAKAASQYYFINGLDRRGNQTLHYGFISEDGQWVVKPSKLALRQSKLFSKAHPGRTQAYGWGIDSLTIWLFKNQGGADTATFKNAINDGGSDTLIISAGSYDSALRTSDPEGEGDDFNNPVLCPPFCGGGVGG